MKQEARLAKRAKLQPGIMRSGNSVVLLGFLLFQTSPGDAGLVHLESLKRLQSVGLTGTQVTDDGVQRLQESLPDTLVVH